MSKILGIFGGTLSGLYKQPKMRDYPEPKASTAKAPDVPSSTGTAVSSTAAMQAKSSTDVTALVAEQPDTENLLRKKQKQQDISRQYQSGMSTMLSEAATSRKETLS